MHYASLRKVFLLVSYSKHIISDLKNQKGFLTNEQAQAEIIKNLFPLPLMYWWVRLTIDFGHSLDE